MLTTNQNRKIKVLLFSEQNKKTVVLFTTNQNRKLLVFILIDSLKNISAYNKKGIHKINTLLAKCRILHDEIAIGSINQKKKYLSQLLRSNH